MPYDKNPICQPIKQCFFSHKSSSLKESSLLNRIKQLLLKENNVRMQISVGNRFWISFCQKHIFRTKSFTGITHENKMDFFLFQYNLKKFFPAWNAGAIRRHFTVALTKSASVSFEISEDFSIDLGF